MQQTQGEVTNVTNTGRSHSYDNAGGNYSFNELNWESLVQQTQVQETVCRVGRISACV